MRYMGRGKMLAADAAGIYDDANAYSMPVRMNNVLLVKYTET